MSEKELSVVIEAVVYQRPFEVAVQEVNDPRIEDPTSAICGSGLHMYEGRIDADPGHRVRPRQHGHCRGGRLRGGYRCGAATGW